MREKRDTEPQPITKSEFHSAVDAAASRVRNAVVWCAAAIIAAALLAIAVVGGL